MELSPIKLGENASNSIPINSIQWIQINLERSQL